MEKKIVFPSNACTIVLDVNEIIYCEAQGNYSKIVCINQKENLVTKYLKDLEELLGDKGFIRIHRKYLVNSKFISEYALNGNPHLKLGGTIELPISERRIMFVKKAIKEIL